MADILFCIDSVLKSTQMSSPSKDVVSKYFFGKNESHPYKWCLDKSLKVLVMYISIKNTQKR